MTPKTFDLGQASLDHTFAEKVFPDKAKLYTCIQCGTCTASCPTAYAMEYTPRKLMRMINVGMHEDVLKSNTFWLCTTCYSCTVRCPRGIAVTETMAALKRLSVAKGMEKKTDSARFYQTVMDMVRTTGRMHETQTMVRWMLRTNPFQAFSFASLGLAMLRKGKMSLRAPKIKGVDQIQAMFDKAREIEEREEVQR